VFHTNDVGAFEYGFVSVPIFVLPTQYSTCFSACAS
jgi:hypothetical protein